MKIKKDVLIARLVFLLFCIIVISIAVSVVKHVSANKKADEQVAETTEIEVETEDGSEFSDIVVSTGVDYLDTVTYVKTTSSVNLRTGASQDSEVVVTLPAETELQLLDSNLEGWYKVLYTDESGNEQECYVSTDFAEIQENEAAAGTEEATGEPVYKESSTDVNVRSGAGTGYEKVGALEKGMEVQVLQEVDGDDGEKWSQIQSGDSLTGYVKSEFLQ